MAYSIEVISIGKDNYSDIQTAIEILNSVQDEFVYSVPPNRLKDNGSSYDLEEYHSKEIFSWLEKYREKARGDRRYLIGVIQGSLRSDKWTNLFGSSRAVKGLATFTVIDQSKFTQSRIAFFCYYLLRYSLGFVGPKIKSHEDAENCFFHFKREKVKITESLTAGKLCDKCTKQFEDYFNPEIVKGFKNVASTISEIEKDESKYLKELKKNKGQTKSKYFDFSDKWWLASLIVGLVAFLISIILIGKWKIALALGIIASVLTIFRNPKTRFMRAFWAVLSLLISVNYFSINLILNYLHKSDNSDLDVQLSIKEPSVILSILLILLLIILAILDYHERKKE